MWLLIVWEVNGRQSKKLCSLSLQLSRILDYYDFSQKINQSDCWILRIPPLTISKIKNNNYYPCPATEKGTKKIYRQG